MQGKYNDGFQNKHFDAFIDAHGEEFADEFLGELADMLWNHAKQSDRIHILDVHQINACNHVATGALTVDGEEIAFSIEMGDINGCVVHSWGDDDEPYQPPRPVMRRFVPRDDDLKERRPEMWMVYQEWRKKEWFIEKERGMNYDFHFAPGCKTESYYKAWAEQKGLKIEISAPNAANSQRIIR